MQRLALPLAALGLLALSLTGCCCHGCGGGYGAGYAPACPPANPCAPAYGTFGAAPAVVAPGGCPSGNCGMYPTGAFYGPTAPVAAAPAVYATAALPMDPLPTF
ncbi:MAG TPA: hypothetical protein VF170_19415 [Planctomycetaceae bacterium]